MLCRAAVVSGRRSGNAGQVGSLLHQQVDTVPNDCRFIRLASFAPGIGYNAILAPVTFDKFNLLVC